MSAPRIHIETYGCAFNFSDGEALSGLLREAGYEIVADPDCADAIIVNTCTVKDRTFLNFRKRFDRLRAASEAGEGPRVIVSGCIPKAYRKAPWLEGVSMIGPDTLESIGDVVAATLEGRDVQILRAEREQLSRRARLPAERRNPVIEILPISRGCLSACTFCQTRLARGRLASFRPIDIVEQARRAVGEGVRELWVTSQDTGAYGKDIDYSLARLLRQLCELPGDDPFRIRLGMTSPIWIYEDLEAILDVLEHPRMFKFMHVPVQSGSDAVLEAMKRGNTVAQYEALCEAFLARFPEGTLMTDIIAGFPGESARDFEATLDLLRRIPHAAVNRSRFSPRPGTPAAAMPQLPSATVSERSNRLNELVREQARHFHHALVGRCETVLTAEHKKAGTTLAHNASYRPIVLEGDWELGQWVQVRYTSASDFHLKATPARNTVEKYFPHHIVASQAAS